MSGHALLVFLVVRKTPASTDAWRKSEAETPTTFTTAGLLFEITVIAEPVIEEILPIIETLLPAERV